ncbi:MAG: cyclic nucleotide-binding domain-containing protein, partial [Lachnospiraceae bacterium]|nr:cyclic nucleotide-binding domain-containing protein [Lachnospiraceae bacterium]
MEQSDEIKTLQNIFGVDISPYVTIREFEPDEFLIREGERLDYLFYLMEGRAKLFLSQENGKISLINFIEAPCFIGEMELLDESRLPQGVKAISLCRCYQIEISRCRELLLQDVKFLRYLCAFLSEKATQNTNNYMRNQ